MQMVFIVNSGKRIMPFLKTIPRDFMCGKCIVPVIHVSEKTDGFYPGKLLHKLSGSFESLDMLLIYPANFYACGFDARQPAIYEGDGRFCVMPWYTYGKWCAHFNRKQ